MSSLLHVQKERSQDTENKKTAPYIKESGKKEGKKRKISAD